MVTQTSQLSHIRFHSHTAYSISWLPCSYVCIAADSSCQSVPEYSGNSRHYLLIRWKCNLDWYCSRVLLITARDCPGLPGDCPGTARGLPGTARGLPGSVRLPGYCPGARDCPGTRDCPGDIEFNITVGKRRKNKKFWGSQMIFVGKFKVRINGSWFVIHESKN